MSSINKTIAVYDIETPFITDKGIKAISEIYCIAVALIIDGVASPAKIYTNYWTTYSNGSLLEAINIMNNADIICAHNGVGFDDIVIRNVLEVNIKQTMYDTLILSKVMFSKDELFEIDAKLDIPKDLWASFSLKAFGYRLGNYKIQYDEFDNGLTKELCTYCKRDTDLTAQLILHLMNQESFPLEKVITIEHQAAAIIAEQTANGFYFDIDKANELNTALLTEKAEIARELSTVFKPKFLKKGQPQTYKKLSKFRKYLPKTKYIPLLGTT